MTIWVEEEYGPERYGRHGWANLANIETTISCLCRADERDRDIDAAVMNVLGFSVNANRFWRYLELQNAPNAGLRNQWLALPHFYSFDTARHWLQRTLPGWTWALDATNPGKGIEVQLVSGTSHVTSLHPTSPGLALTIAMLRAIQTLMRSNKGKGRRRQWRALPISSASPLAQKEISHHEQ